jgi:hypothetical protein
LEEPLFGPVGKLPKITREPRLPDAEPDQMNPEIPVEPKQSNVPEELEISTEDQSITESKTSETQEDEIGPAVLEVEKLESDSLSTPSDSLKLESLKETPTPIEEETPAQPEESQPDNESEKEKTDDVKTEENDGSDA